MALNRYCGVYSSEPETGYCVVVFRDISQAVNIYHHNHSQRYSVRYNGSSNVDIIRGGIIETIPIDKLQERLGEQWLWLATVELPDFEEPLPVLTNRCTVERITLLELHQRYTSGQL